MLLYFKVFWIHLCYFYNNSISIYVCMLEFHYAFRSPRVCFWCSDYFDMYECMLFNIVVSKLCFGYAFDPFRYRIIFFVK